MLFFVSSFFHLLLCYSLCLWHFLFLSFLMLFFVSSFFHLLLCYSLFLSFYHSPFLSFLMLFFVFIILSLSLSVFPYVILCFFLLLPSLMLFFVFIILSLSLSVFLESAPTSAREKATWGRPMCRRKIAGPRSCVTGVWWSRGGFKLQVWGRLRGPL